MKKAKHLFLLLFLVLGSCTKTGSLKDKFIGVWYFREVVTDINRNKIIDATDLHYFSNFINIYVFYDNEKGAMFGNNWQPNNYYPFVWNLPNINTLFITNVNGSQLYQKFYFSASDTLVLVDTTSDGMYTWTKFYKQ